MYNDKLVYKVVIWMFLGISYEREGSFKTAFVKHRLFWNPNCYNLGVPTLALMKPTSLGTPETHISWHSWNPHLYLHRHFQHAV